MRIALFGGSFDPPHRGHLAIARAAADAFGLDYVLFAPTGRQPLKLDAEPAPFHDRLAMVTLACVDAEEHRPDHRLVATDLDAPHGDLAPNYTVDLLAALERLYPRAGNSLFHLAGADSFLTIHRWREPERLLELAEWIVVTRPGYELSEAQLAPLGLSAEQRSRVHLLAGVHEDVSATSLRERLRQGELCADLLSPAVAAYIQQHRLYSARD